MKLIRHAVMILSLLIVNSASAEDVIMVRASEGFVNATTTLQNAVVEHNYTLSRVQRVDIGLSKAGYKTDRYRIVFFGKQNEYKVISEKYPQLTAYIPLRIVIYAEGDETMLVALNPTFYSNIVSNKEMNVLYKRWENDMRSILNQVLKSE